MPVTNQGSERSCICVRVSILPLSAILRLNLELPQQCDICFPILLIINKFKQYCVANVRCCSIAWQNFPPYQLYQKSNEWNAMQNAIIVHGQSHCQTAMATAGSFILPDCYGYCRLAHIARLSWILPTRYIPFFPVDNYDSSHRQYNRLTICLVICYSKITTYTASLLIPLSEIKWHICCECWKTYRFCINISERRCTH